MRLLLVGENSPHLSRIASHLCATLHDAQVDVMHSSEVEEVHLRQIDGVIYAPTDDECVAAPSSEQIIAATRDSYRLMTRALDAGVRRFVLLSSLRLFAALPPDCRIDEMWRARPAPDSRLLCWLAESSTREIMRGTDARVVCLRLGADVSQDDVGTVLAQSLQDTAAGWQVKHLGNISTLPTPKPPVLPPIRDAQRVIIFGAGGPLGAAVASALKDDYVLTLTDVRPLDEIIAEGARRDQFPGAPVAEMLTAPHRVQVVDIGDQDAVIAACAGHDIIINCSVVRGDVEGAFRVNTLGAYHLARAARTHGIRRIIQTGPQLHTLSGTADYSGDDRIVEDAPPRPGRHLYAHSKYLGQEILRVFAEAGGLEAAVLLFDGLLRHDIAIQVPLEPLAVSWRDAAQAVRHAIWARLPTPYETFFINADLPHGRFGNHKAKAILGWHPQDDLRLHWSSEAT